MRWIVIFFLLTNIAFGDEDYKEGFHIPRDLSYLNLSKSQKESFKKLLKEYRVILKKIHQKEEKLEESLERLFVKKSFNKEAFLKENQKLKLQMAKAEAEFFAKVHTILTKKQRKKFIKYIEEWEIE